MDLLLEADPNRSAVENYISNSTVLVALDESVAAIAVLACLDEYYELKNIVVRNSYRGRGIAKALILEVMKTAKSLGATELIVGTGNSSLSQLALYQKCGFRMSHIKSDFFANYPERIYENGIQCIDMVILKAEL